MSMSGSFTLTIKAVQWNEFTGTSARLVTNAVTGLERAISLSLAPPLVGKGSRRMKMKKIGFNKPIRPLR